MFILCFILLNKLSSFSSFLSIFIFILFFSNFKLFKKFWKSSKFLYSFSFISLKSKTFIKEPSSFSVLYWGSINISFFEFMKLNFNFFLFLYFFLGRKTTFCLSIGSYINLYCFGFFEFIIFINNFGIFAEHVII